MFTQREVFQAACLQLLLVAARFPLDWIRTGLGPFIANDIVTCFYLSHIAAISVTNITRPVCYFAYSAAVLNWIAFSHGTFLQQVTRNLALDLFCTILYSLYSLSISIVFVRQGED